VVVRDFFNLAAEGSRPSELATLANLHGWKNHAGEVGRWTARGITKLLSNPIHTGRIHNGTETLPGEQDSIVDQETFDEVQCQIESRRTRTSSPGERKDNPPPKLLLRGILICGDCQRQMSTSISQRGSIRYPYYRCRSTAGGRPPCPGVNIQYHEFEALVCRILAEPCVDDVEEIHAIAAVWNRLDQVAQRKTLPIILSQAVFKMSTGDTTIELVDDAVDLICKLGEIDTDKIRPIAIHFASSR